MKAIILAGGRGLRLWPLSRKLLPKQFLPIVYEGDSHLSTYQHTLLTAGWCEAINEVIVVCPKELMATAKAQARDYILPASVQFVDEGVPKGTLRAALVGINNSASADSNILVMSSDMVIDRHVFRKAIKEGERKLEEDEAYWIIFGIPVNSENPSYGHFKINNEEKVETYIEKPSNPSQLFKESGYDSWFWNAGMFLFNTKARNSHIRTIINGLHLSKSFRPIDDVTQHLVQKGAVYGIPILTDRWSDYGNWDSVQTNLTNQGIGNSKNNVTIGNVGFTKCKNTLIYSTNDIPVIGIGLENMIVVNTGDAILVTAKGCTNELKDTVTKIASAQETTQPYKEEKPWGKYEVLHQTTNMKIKKITIWAGQETSLQMHERRQEILFVISGTVTVGDHELHKNNSFLIEPHMKHRISNHSNDVAELIEIQQGTCLDENDITRIEDKYGREDHDKLGSNSD